MSASQAAAPRVGADAPSGPTLGLVRRAKAALALRLRRRRAASALQALSDRTLDDMGLARSDIGAVVAASLRRALHPPR